MKKIVLMAFLGLGLIASVSSCKKCKDCTVKGTTVSYNWCGSTLDAAEKSGGYDCK